MHIRWSCDVRWCSALLGAATVQSEATYTCCQQCRRSMCMRWELCIHCRLEVPHPVLASGRLTVGCHQPMPAPRPQTDLEYYLVLFTLPETCNISSSSMHCQQQQQHCRWGRSGPEYCRGLKLSHSCRVAVDLRSSALPSSLFEELF